MIKYLTVKKKAEQLGITRQWLHKLIKKGKIEVWRPAKNITLIKESIKR